MKKFILFDNDGVLVETEPLYFEANVKALSELGIKLTFERYMKIMARGGTAWEVAREAGITKEVIDKKRFQRDEYYQEFIKTRDIEIPDVKEILKELSKKYKMGIITTSRRVDFELIHKNRGITDFMDFVLCVEDYPKAKPYPDPYLAGLEKFKANASEAIVVEDSQRGLSSAVNAGIDCVIVKNEFTLTHDFSKASYRIDTLKDLLNIL
ncbi:MULTISPECIES: HAD family hydrolase [Arcobacteraceae]|uniref:phosphoglycolate phosphatase n=1 Tax=Poseidonibacter parvus TaxID=1850254 RepID=A0A1P8KLM9_9BACT|nr:MULTISPECIES: HAD family hydrolase [Arcobacteraceae]APW65450.1 HAD family hydrolase [Poseidonibacter parvus]